VLGVNLTTTLQLQPRTKLGHFQGLQAQMAMSLGVSDTRDLSGAGIELKYLLRGQSGSPNVAVHKRERCNAAGPLSGTAQ